MKRLLKKILGLRLYLGIFLFSAVWLVLSVVGFSHQLNYQWDNFMANLPADLYSLSGLLPFNVDQGRSPYTFLFGKYYNKPGNGKVVIAAIDDYTVKKYGYPFKHRYYGQLVDKLKALGAKSIGMDVLLLDPDRDEPYNDKLYVDAVAKTGIVVNLVNVDYGTWKISKPFPPLVRVSALIAEPNVDVTQDNDGQVRRYAPFYPGMDTNGDSFPDKFLTYQLAGLTGVRCWKDCKDVSIPSLGMATYAVYSGKSLPELEMRYGSQVILNYRYPVLRRLHPEWNRNKDNLLDPEVYRNISVADILQGRLSGGEKAAIKGGIVLVGSTALAAFDHIPSAFQKQMPGVYVHANFIDDLLAGDFRAPLGYVSETILILFLPWIPVLLRRFSLGTLLSLSALAMLLLVVSYVALLAHYVLMPFASVFLALFLPFAYIAVNKGLSESREKKWIKSTFGQYLSPKVIEVITKDPSKLTLGGEKRDMTAMFCDIAGFTTISERLEPEQLTEMLNVYLSGLTDVIMKYDGVVDKFIGDCIVAFWNAPLDLAEHRRMAVTAAVECLAINNKLNAEARDKTIQPMFRIGVNSGPMTVGNMGSRNRFSYTVIGDAVNLASRLEGANKFFHSRVMASADTFESVKDFFDYRLLGSIRVVGKAIPVRVYEPFARKGEAPPEVRAMLGPYAAGVEKFYKGDYKGSLEDFRAAQKARPGDGPSQFYIGTAEEFLKEPPKDWDGSINFTSKG